MRKIIATFLSILLIFISSGCQDNQSQVAAPTPSKEVEPITVPLSELTVEEVVKNLSLHKKAAQMVQAERNAITPLEAKNYGIGSILSGGGSSPSTNTPEGWANMYNEYQSMITKTNQIPILYGVDAVHGHNNVHGAVIFPHNIGLGAARNPQLIYEIGKIVSKEVAITGIDWNFAPAVSVVQDIRWGRTYESFGESPELQALLAGPYVKGLQESNIIATAKHFIADGGTSWDESKEGYKIDQGDAILSDAEIREIHLQGYLEAMEAGVDSVMVSFSSINGQKLHGSKALITDLLKGELGFEGIVISDWEAIHQLPGKYYDQVVASINSGVDMLMEPNRWKETINTIVNAVNRGDISEERINDAVTRILKIKYKYNLIEEPLVAFNGIDFASDESKAVARQAVRESLVLLKNEKQILPLKKDTKILLMGPGIDNVGYQCGGWTLEWQGTSDPQRVPGTSILEAFTEEAGKNGGQIITDISKAGEADVVILVIGEKPYTEGVGDNGELTLNSHTAMVGNMEAVQKARDTGLPVITVMISGRPMIITNELTDWDAFVMAWLPGSEGGAGICEVLYGDYDFKGKLPVTWPKDQSQFGYTVNHQEYDEAAVLFPYQYGLNYNAP